MPDDEMDELTEAAKKPKKASVDGIDVEGHPLTEQIEQDKYRRAGDAINDAGLGIKRTRTSPPGGAE